MRTNETKAGGCQFYVKSDLHVERYVDDNSIKRLRHKNWYLYFSLFFFKHDLRSLDKYASEQYSKYLMIQSNI